MLLKKISRVFGWGRAFAVISPYMPFIIALLVAGTCVGVVQRIYKEKWYRLQIKRDKSSYSSCLNTAVDPNICYKRLSNATKK